MNKFMIETERLKIIPLTYEEVILYKSNRNELENNLGLKESNSQHTGQFIEMLEDKLLPLLKDKKDDYIFYTIWLATDKIENAIVCDFGIKGIPDINNEIEIGYGTQEQYKGRGYMTEAIRGFINWVSCREDIRAVIAETDKGNIPSVRVLEKNDFSMYKETEAAYWWRKENEKFSTLKSL